MATTAPPTTLAPTTLAPTTSAPTTLATTLAPTTTLTTAAPTTAVPDTNLTAGPAIIYLFPKAVRSDYPTPDPDPALDKYYEIDPFEIELIPLGEMSTVSVHNPINTITLIPLGSLVLGVPVVSDASEIELIPLGTITVENKRCNFAKWSKIGRAEFTIERDNEAGERPMDWKGCIYECLKLGKSVVYYGENGVTKLVPQGVHMEMSTSYRIGILCKTAVVGDENEHFFIDKTYKLFRVNNEGLQLLDYSEYLENMSNPVMSYDRETGYVYICDGTYGYVFSSRYNSFGEGPVNVTGIGVQDGSLYAVAPDTIEVPKFEICTDIYDFGTRKPKTVYTMEIGTDLSNRLQVQVETRLKNIDEFNKSVWKLVNPSGIAHIPCYGVEFQFRLRSYIYEYFELDYIKVSGSVHEFNYLNSV